MFDDHITIIIKRGLQIFDDIFDFATFHQDGSPDSDLDLDDNRGLGTGNNTVTGTRNPSEIQLAPKVFFRKTIGEQDFEKE